MGVNVVFSETCTAQLKLAEPLAQGVYLCIMRRLEASCRGWPGYARISGMR